MKINKISITNCLGVAHLEIEPGSIVLLEGANGTGKTSVLNAIRAAFGTGQDATLLRAGAESGEVVLVLDDGTEISKHIGPDKSPLTVKTPLYGKISKPADFMKRLSDILSLNPIEFLTAPAKERVDLLLKAVPMKVTADQVGFVPVAALNGADLDKHALEVIGNISKSIYDLRTGVNRAAKEQRITAQQLQETLPENPEEGNWRDELDRANAEYRSLYKATQTRIEAIKADCRAASESAKELFKQTEYALFREEGATIEGLRSDLNKEIERLKDECQKAVIKLQEQTQAAIKVHEQTRDKTLAEAGHHQDEALKSLESEARPQLDHLTAEISKAKTMLEEHTRHETTRQNIQAWTEKADKLDAESKNLTAALSKLEVLKGELLANLPIAGMEIKDGELFIGGIPWERVNESKRIRLAIEIAKLRAGSLGLVCCDGLERLDPKTFAAFKKEAARSGLQFVISRVTDDATLQVRSEVVA